MKKRISLFASLVIVAGLALAQIPARPWIHRHDPPVFSTTVTLTSTEVDNLDTSPPSLVPAAGAGTYVLPSLFIFEYQYGNQVFDNSNQPQLNFMWGTDYTCPQGGIGTNASGTWMTVPLSTISLAQPALADAAVAVKNTGHVAGWCSGIDNQPIKLINGNVGANFMGGGTSTLKVTTLYYVLND